MALPHGPRMRTTARPDGVNGSVSFRAERLFDHAAQLLSQGQYAEAERYFQAVLGLLPGHASALNNLGTAIWRQGRIHEAEECYRQAVVYDSGDSAILNNLGNILREQGRLDEAEHWLRNAVSLRPDSAVALMHLGVVLSDLGEFDEALGFIRDSLHLMPKSPASHVNLGNTLARQGNLDEALACYENALRLLPDFPAARRYRAYLWLARGDFANGWPEHEWRLKCANGPAVTVNSPRWTGGELNGRSILLVAEQGLGDVLQFIRFAPAVKARSPGGRSVPSAPDPAACALPVRRPCGRFKLAPAGLRRSRLPDESARDSGDDLA